MPPESRRQRESEWRVLVTRSQAIENMEATRLSASPQGEGDGVTGVAMNASTVNVEARRWTWLAPSGAGMQRPSGNDRKATGRGDTNRLLTRGKLRRVAHRAEGAWDGDVEANSFVEARKPWRAKRDEPHGR